MPTFHATVKTTEAQRRMLLYIAAVPNELAAAVQQIADDAALIFSGYAPKGKTGAIGRSVRVISAQGRLSSGRFATGRQFAVYASARNRGYDYVGVTRFGHRNRLIYPRMDREDASVISTRLPRRKRASKKALERAGTPGQLPALMIPYGTPTFQHKVRGIIQPVDWVDTAIPAVNRELDARAKQLAHNLERRFG